jgi:hypothetical protein
MAIKIETIDKELSANGGLVIFGDLVTKPAFRDLIADSLPSLASGTGRSFDKFLGLMLAFKAGAECLDDLDRLNQDEGFQALCEGRIYTSKAHGDFLRSFTHLQCKQLSQKLARHAFALRKAVGQNEDSITLDFDSTSNRQYGRKMEGVTEGYKLFPCLDTIQVFDEYGLQYWNDVRPGNTHTAAGACEIMHAVFSEMPPSNHYAKMRRYVRADAGFCNIDFFNSCLAAGTGFVVRLTETMLQPRISTLSHWKSQKLTNDKRIKFYDGRECEIGESVCRPDGCASPLRIVCVRAVKPGMEKLLFKTSGDYDYFAWITSIGEHEMSGDALIRFYRKRGNAENFIRELKYGYDLKHYPCQKLVANKAYGIIAAFAHNFVRLIALRDCFETPQFAKAIRYRFIHLPVQVVRHAGQVVFRFMKRHIEEVKRWQQLITSLQYGTA